MIGILLLSSFLFPTRSNAQIVIAPQPYISSSGVAVGPVICNGTAPCIRSSVGTNLTLGTLSIGTDLIGIYTRGVLNWTIDNGNIADQGSHTITAGSTIRGTAFGVNAAPGATGSVVATADITAGAANGFIISGNSKWTSSTDGLVQLTNNAGTGFTRLILGANDATSNGASLLLTGGNLSFLTGDGSSSNIGIRVSAIGLNTTIPTAGNLAMSGKISIYNGVSTTGWGVPSIVASGRATAQTAANASVATYTVGAADGSFEVSANVLVTTATSHNFQVTCAYTDEGNTARTVTSVPLYLVGGAGAGVQANIVNTAGAVPYMSTPLYIRAKAGTTITVATTGTFTTVTYNVEGVIKQQS